MYLKILMGLAVLGAIFLGAVGIQLTLSPESAELETKTTPTQVESSPSGEDLKDTSPATSETSATPAADASEGGYSREELLAIAGNDFASGSVPLGDYRYVTDAPKKGYVYLCNARKDNPGSAANGPWITGETWNFLKKAVIEGSVSWPNAAFTNTLSGTVRTLSGNALPLGHTTGIFPVAQSDPARKYDPNPNTIAAQNLKLSLPANPAYSETPYCMGGEVGIMLSGVPLFNAFDAGLRDAPAHELQDSCGGHPQGTGEYHYHSLSPCFKDVSASTVLGYAFDGFPITGGKVAEGKYLATADLDICHGITSEVVLDGKSTMTYHYVMTQDFPYSVSCFRGKPATTGPTAGGAPTSGQGGMGGTQPGAGGGGQPPQEATAACSGKKKGDTCYMPTPNGMVMMGTCETPPGSSLACVPY